MKQQDHLTTQPDDTLPKKFGSIIVGSKRDSRHPKARWIQQTCEAESLHSNLCVSNL